ncbi:MAG: MATE family efflux transporter [Victivallales bacterium]|nr:MATE family efflux transporter [Victivallales bacterium]
MSNDSVNDEQAPAAEGGQPAKKKNEATYTHGSIGWTMFRTAIEMLPATLAMQGYNMADTFFVGQLHDEKPLAAMGFTFPVVMLINGVFFGLGTGVMTTLAHALGRQDRKLAQKLTSSGEFLVALSALVLGTLGMLFAKPLFGLMGAKGETLQLTCEYMDVWFLGCITAALTFLGNKLLITVGIPRLASIMTIVGMVLNVILDPLMIFGTSFCENWIFGKLGFHLHLDALALPSMGIKGAAVATIISQAVSAVFSCWLLWKNKYLEFKTIPFSELMKYWHQIVRYAIPAMLGMFLFPIANFITTKITSKFGDAAVAGVSAGNKLQGVFFVVPMSLGITLTPMMAQNFGARLYGRVKTCLYMSVRFAQVYLSCAAVVCIIGAPYIVRFFSPVQEVQDVMKLFLRIVSFGFGSIEAMRFSCFCLTACGHPKMDSWVKVARVIGFQIPLALLGWATMNLTVLFIGTALSDILSFALSFMLAYRLVKKFPEDGMEFVEA